MTVPILSVRNLSASFRSDDGWETVVEDIHFDVAPNETVAIVGESGSGKSVTSMSILGLLPRNSCKVEGQAMFDGRELLTLPEEEMRRIRGNDIAMIFQEPMTSLNPVLSIGFQVAEALVLHRGISYGDARKEAVRLLDRVRIPSAANRVQDYPHNFSGGMRQRVMIAMALACKPKLLIADEPTTALDVTMQAEILELMRELQQQERMGLLFITHDMGVVAEIADRTMVMYQGRQVEMATTSEIFARPKMPYTRALLSAVPQLGSMHGHGRPVRFPLMDPVTGFGDTPKEATDTVRREGGPVLEVSNLTTRYDLRSGLFSRVHGRVHAVENVSFALQAGETFALVGESGCGKSTIGRTIMRLVQPVAGAIRLDGRNLLEIGSRELRKKRSALQMIFQDPFASLNPRMRVGDAISDPLIVNGMATGEAREVTAGLLRQVGLSADMAKRFPHEFSGGQRQRICIARALALKPKVIVADEAVSALDVSVKAQVVNLMLDLQEQLGLSYLFISHDMAVVERLSHRVAVMYLGEIVEIGPRQAVFDNPQHPYTRKLLAAVPIANPELRGTREKVAGGEVKSPVRPVGYIPPARDFREVSPGHLVMEHEGWLQ